LITAGLPAGAAATAFEIALAEITFAVGMLVPVAVDGLLQLGMLGIELFRLASGSPRAGALDF
jgi:hypothetical protein